MSELNPIKISVIMPVYNVEDYLDETLKSILNQTLSDIEIITINDGSTDSSLDILKKYADDYPNIQVIDKKNEGPSIARNVGLDLAQGDFIKFVDADDIVPYDAFEAEYRAAIEHQADVIIGATYRFNSLKKYPMTSHYNRGVYIPGEKSILQNPEILYSVGPCNKLYKRELVQNYYFPTDIKVTEDHPFVINAYLRASKIYTIDKVIYLYRVREQAQNASLSQLVETKAYEVFKDIFNSLSISKKLIDSIISNPYERDIIYANYLERLVVADIWPAFRKIIDSLNGKNQVNAIQFLHKFIDGLDNRVFNLVKPLHLMLVKWPVERYLRLSKEARLRHLQLSQLYFLKVDGESRMFMERRYIGFIHYATKAAKSNNIRYYYLYLADRRVKRISNKIRKKIKTKAFLYAKKISFAWGKVLGVKRNTIVIATNKGTELSGNLKFIHDEIYRQKLPFATLVYPAHDIEHEETISDVLFFYYRASRAKYIIIDDYYRQLYGMKFHADTEIIQVWHACGAFKKFAFSSIGSKDSNPIEFEEKAHNHYTKVIASSDEIVGHYAEAFNIEKKNVLPIGVPRTDVFFDKDYQTFIQKSIYQKYPQLEGKKVITYAPTFRGGPKERKTFRLELDLKKMVQAFGDEYVIVLKMHPSVANAVNVEKEIENYIVDMSLYPEMNDVLLITDVLISDYSSLVFEYALLDRPMIFYAYDLEEYIGERDFYYEYKSFVPGPIAKTTDEIISLIQGELLDLEKIQAFKHKFFNEHDGKATQRFVNLLK